MPWLLQEVQRGNLWKLDVGTHTDREKMEMVHRRENTGCTEGHRGGDFELAKGRCDKYPRGEVRGEDDPHEMLPGRCCYNGHCQRA